MARLYFQTLATSVPRKRSAAVVVAPARHNHVIAARPQLQSEGVRLLPFQAEPVDPHATAVGRRHRATDGEAGQQLHVVGAGRVPRFLYGSPLGACWTYGDRWGGLPGSDQREDRLPATSRLRQPHQRYGARARPERWLELFPRGAARLRR